MLMLGWAQSVYTVTAAHNFVESDSLGASSWWGPWWLENIIDWSATIVLLTSVSCPCTCLMGMAGCNWLEILAIMLELCLCQIGSYYAQNYVCRIITSLLMHPLLWLRGHVNPHWLSVRHWFGWHLTDCPHSRAHHGGRAWYPLFAHVLNWSQQLRGVMWVCTIMMFKNLWMCAMMHMAYYWVCVLCS